MNSNGMSKIIKEIESIKEYCAERTHYSYDELYEDIETRVEALNSLAKKLKVPMVLDLEDLVNEYVSEEDESSSYYEEPESSSYYEEPSSW